MMNAKGSIPAGELSQRLLQADPTAPFGVRLDPNAVEMNFATNWNAKSVVLVEASDLVRVEESRRSGTHARRRRRCARARCATPTPWWDNCSPTSTSPGMRSSWSGPRRIGPTVGLLRSRSTRPAWRPGCCDRERRSAPGSCRSWTWHRRCSSWPASRYRAPCGAGRWQWPMQRPMSRRGNDSWSTRIARPSSATASWRRSHRCSSRC